MAQSTEAKVPVPRPLFAFQANAGKFQDDLHPHGDVPQDQELQKFYKAGMGAIITPLIDELFEKTYKEAELLARINSRETRDEA